MDFAYVGASFVPVSGDKAAMTLADFSASDDFIFSTVQFWTSGGANQRVTVGKFANVMAKYVYWADASWTTAGVAGWYLEDDLNAEYPQNDVEIPAGGGFIINRYSSETAVSVSLPAAL